MGGCRGLPARGPNGHPDHTLYGRSPAPVRPGRHYGSRSDRGSGHPPRPDPRARAQNDGGGDDGRRYYCVRLLARRADGRAGKRRGDALYLGSPPDGAGLAGAQESRAGGGPPAPRGGGELGRRLLAAHRAEAARMRGLATTLLMGLRMYVRDRGAVFWGIAFPLILMTLIGLAFGRSGTPTYCVAVVDRDAGLLGQGLVAGLRGLPRFSIAEISDTDTALAPLRQGRPTLVGGVPPTGPGHPV